MKRKSFTPGAVIFLLAFALGLSGCIKEYSVEGGNVLAVAKYTLEGSGGACTNYTVTGSYFAGKPLGAANTVKLQAYVYGAGSYSISTNTANGVSFTASGNFAGTGLQMVTLTAAGTPLAEGSFTYKTLNDSSCSFTVVFTKTSAAYSLRGSPGACASYFVNGNYVYGATMDGSNSVDVTAVVTVPGPYAITTDTLDGIYFAASGNFTSTGIKQVSLPGHGTAGTPQNLTFHVSGDTSACSFGMSVVNPQPLATYVLESNFGTPNPCNGTIDGTYKANTPLVASNTVTIHVYVAVVGNYTILTDNINGIMFSRTGTFTSKGEQTVTLTGTGTPMAPGPCTLNTQIVGPAPLGGQACALNFTVN